MHISSNIDNCYGGVTNGSIGKERSGEGLLYDGLISRHLYWKRPAGREPASIWRKHTLREGTGARPWAGVYWAGSGKSRKQKGWGQVAEVLSGSRWCHWGSRHPIILSLVSHRQDLNCHSEWNGKPHRYYEENGLCGVKSRNRKSSQEVIAIIQTGWWWLVPGWMR